MEGMYLALTGARLKGEDVVKSGVATHYVPRQHLPDMMATLSTVSSHADFEAVVRLSPFCRVARLTRLARWSSSPGIACGVGGCL